MILISMFFYPAVHVRHFFRQREFIMIVIDFIIFFSQEVQYNPLSLKAEFDLILI